MKLLLSREQQPLPPLIDGFATGEVALHLGYIQDFLGNKPFLLGDALQGPDIGITYILQWRKGSANSPPIRRSKPIASA